jgi:hypothetical protein
VNHTISKENYVSKKDFFFQLEHVNMAHLKQRLTMAMFLHQLISTGMG